MKKQLLSWAQNLTHPNKWDRLGFRVKATFVAAWVWHEDGVFRANIFNELPSGDPLIRADFSTLEKAQAFADQELKKQGYSTQG